MHFTFRVTRGGRESWLPLGHGGSVILGAIIALAASPGAAHAATPSDDDSCVGVGGSGPLTFRLSGAWSSFQGGLAGRDRAREALASTESESAMSGAVLADWTETLGSSPMWRSGSRTFPQRPRLRTVKLGSW